MNDTKDLTAHWNKTYTRQEVTQLGWYEANPEPSLQLIKDLNLSKTARILNVGNGASILIDELLNEGYQNLIANDLSKVALNKLIIRLGERQKLVSWIVDDLIQPKILQSLEPVDLWHDRAVLHFFTAPDEQENYFNLLRNLVKPGGFVILAAFNLDGAEKCSGLPVFRYNEKMLQKKLGKEFEMTSYFNFTYQMPGGETREYVYTVFVRQIV